MNAKTISTPFYFKRANALFILTALAVLIVSGCTTTPERIDELERARSAVVRLEGQPMVQETAPRQLDSAKEALARADAALEKRRPLVEVRHDAYLARRHAEIGLQIMSEARARETIGQAESRRRQVQLQAREAEAESAQRRAERQTAIAERSQREAEQARDVAQAAIDEAKRLAGELDDMEAKQTERGLVLTLGDVLFATNSADLKAGTALTMDRLAEFLNNNPERRLLIEGHTDSRGAEQYNQELSARRAASVSAALAQRGIASNRLRTTGLGESYPVASNDTSAGMQQNRRVEIVISGPDGTFPTAAEQRAAMQ